MIHFTKMHGAGNDYIYVDSSLYNIEDPAAAAVAWSDRHKGIGSDGLVLIGRSERPDADFTMRIFNADGSEARMCGNASRCIGKYVFEKGLTRKTEIRLLTLSGIKTLKLNVRDGHVEDVTVDMGEPELNRPKQFTGEGGAEVSLCVADQAFQGVFVSMGNPHFVIFTSDALHMDIHYYGPMLEHHPAFPERCNIEFAQLLPDGSIRTRVWERGSGVTEACGTGACATAVAAALTGRAPRRSRILMDGGELRILWDENDRHVYMTGPAEIVFEGEAVLGSPGQS